MIEVVCTTITALASILVAVLAVYIKNSEKRAEHDSQLRKREAFLNLKMSNATLELSAENAKGILSGNNFDAIQAALDKANSVSAEYQEFLQEVTAHEIGR